MKFTSMMTSLAVALGLAAFGCKGKDRDESAGKVVEPAAPRTDEPVVPPVAPLAADNTEVNERDRKDSERTADNADMDQASVETMAKIRRSVLDADLSTNADNVKIIVSNGIVTLKGPVASPEEKAAVEAKAAEIVGVRNVVSELAVAP